MNYPDTFSLFSLFNPVFSSIDSAMSFLPDIVKLSFWGVLAGLCSMAIYKRISAQGDLKELAANSKAIQARLKAVEVSDPTYRNLVKSSLRFGGRRLWLSIVPALISAVPVVFLAVWIESNYALSKPESNTLATILVEDPDAITISDAHKFASGWLIKWPEDGETLFVLDNNGDPVYEISYNSVPGLAAAPGIMRLLFGANAGALPADKNIDTIYVETTPRDIFVKDVVFPHQWAIPFFIALLMASLSLKFIFRIK